MLRTVEAWGAAGPFIGRVPELAALEGALARAAGGRPVVVVVGGEGGIGKTRLVDELAGRAHARGIRVLSGGCLALGGAGVPYAPFLEAMRSLVREVEPSRLPALLGPGRTELARLVPEIAGRLAGSAPVASGAAAVTVGAAAARSDAPTGTAGAGASPWVSMAEPAAEPGLARARLFEIVLGAAERLARDAPLLLVIEDLHHADGATRDLLRFLVRNLRDARACLLVTVRTDELVPGGPVATLLGELESRPGTVRLELGPFGRPEMAELLAGRLHEAPTGALVERVLRRSEGNPFYAELLADGLAATATGAAGAGRPGPASAGWDDAGEADEGEPAGERAEAEVPRRLRDIIEARIAALPERTREVLRVAAVAGPRVDDRLLALVAGIPERELFAALRDAVARRVLVTMQGESGGSIAFAHSLIREAVAAQLFPAERAALHARYAEALVAHPDIGGGPIERAASLLHHWEGAGRAEQALAAAVSAGRAAEVVFAFSDASRHYERAIALWDRVPGELRPPGVDRPAVLDRAADTAALSGRYDQAVAWWREALASFDHVAEPGRAATYHERLRWTLWQSGDWAGAAAEVEAALAMTPVTPPSQGRARALAHKAGLLMLAGRPAESMPLAEEALSIARAVDEPAEVSLALGVMAWDLVALGDDEQALALMNVARPLAEAYPRAEGAAIATTNLVGILDKMGRYEEALAVAREAVARTRAWGLERTYGSALNASAASVQIVLGGWDEADRLTADALDREPAGTEAILLGATRGRLLAGRGRFAEAAPLLDAARAAAARANHADHLLRVATADAELALWAGRPDEARAVADAALAPFAAAGSGSAGAPSVTAVGPPSASAGPPSAAAGSGSAAAGSPPAGAPSVTAVGSPSAESGRRPALPGVRPLDLAALGLCALGIRAAADEAERARAVRSPGVLQASVAAGERFLALAETAADRASAPWRSRLLLCRAEAARQAGPGNPDLWAATIDAFETPPRPYDSAYARLRQAEALVAAGAPRTAVAQTLGRARAAAEPLGAMPLLRSIELLARRLRIELVSPEAAPAVVPAARDRPLTRVPRTTGPAVGTPEEAAAGLGLTPREREVLGLVALGRTNREIARELFMSEKTASVHVSNILDKLGAANRVEAAAIAVRLGLAADE
ncbi:MAG: helix-turn-helix transcriptional regulator [Chloroflexi bacterium]|nr:helix-turn-helix transcriptional regulator [Chloroflexota bacterium]